METVDALAKGLATFRGGVAVVTHHQNFLDKLCADRTTVEWWTVANGTLTVS